MNTRNLTSYILAPPPTGMLEVLLAFGGIVRGIGIILFDGITVNTEAYRLALGLAPPQVWAVAILLIGVSHLCAIMFGVPALYRKHLLVLQAHYWAAWTMLLLLSRPSPMMIPLISGWLVYIIGASWVYLVLDNEGSRRG